MESAVGQVRSSSGTNYCAMVKPEFRKGYTIPALPYQSYGILSRMIWATRDQVFRIIPGFDPSTGVVFRQNEHETVYSSKTDPMYFLSPTFYQVSTLERFGDCRSPIITSYKPGSPDALQWEGETVLRHFVRNIVYACSPKGGKFKPVNEWKTWCDNRFGTLSYDKPTLLMQALICVLNGQANKDPEKHDLVDVNNNILPLLAVVGINHARSSNNLMRALTLPADPNAYLDSITNSRLGPMAELNGRMLFLNTCQFKEGAKTCNELQPSVQAGDQGGVPTEYPLDEALVKSLWHPWDELLYFMTAQEQLELCATMYGKDTVNYVIGRDAMLQGLEIPQEIKAAGLGRYAGLINTVAARSAYGMPVNAPAVPGIVGVPGVAPMGVPAVPSVPGMAAPASLGMPGARPAAPGMYPYTPPAGMVAPHAAPVSAIPQQTPAPTAVSVQGAVPGIPQHSNLNVAGILSQVQKMHAATAPAGPDQAAEASELLDESK